MVWFGLLPLLIWSPEFGFASVLNGEIDNASPRAVNLPDSESVGVSVLSDGYEVELQTDPPIPNVQKEKQLYLEIVDSTLAYVACNRCSEGAIVTVVSKSGSQIPRDFPLKPSTDVAIAGADKVASVAIPLTAGETYNYRFKGDPAEREFIAPLAVGGTKLRLKIMSTASPSSAKKWCEFMHFSYMENPFEVVIPLSTTNEIITAEMCSTLPWVANPIGGIGHAREFSVGPARVVILDAAEPLDVHSKQMAWFKELMVQTDRSMTPHVIVVIQKSNMQLLEEYTKIIRKIGRELVAHGANYIYAVQPRLFERVYSNNGQLIFLGSGGGSFDPQEIEDEKNWWPGFTVVEQQAASAWSAIEFDARTFNIQAYNFQNMQIAAFTGARPPSSVKEWLEDHQIALAIGFGIFSFLIWFVFLAWFRANEAPLVGMTIELTGAPRNKLLPVDLEKTDDGEVVMDLCG